jgi:hypothetical protein
VSSVSFASACWAPFCPHPPTNLPSLHVTQTPTICKHRPTRLRPTDPWHTCSYQRPMKQFWFSIRLSTTVGTIFSSQGERGGGKNWCDVSTFHWQWCQHSNKSHWFRHHIWHPFGLQIPFKCKRNHTLRPSIENNTNTGHVLVTKNNLPHIGVVYQRWTWSRGIGKMKMICAIGVFPGS